MLQVRHRWAAEIAAWAAGRLVQFRYAYPGASEQEWRDCNYPSRGMPNWSNDELEFRIAPTEALRDDQIDAAFRQYGTGRKDGFFAAVRALEALRARTEGVKG